MTAAIQIPKQRVLIVDDSRIVRTTIAKLIRTSFDVREEANGEDGWRAIASDPSIAVVFSDLQMPQLDGFGLLERIRGSEDARIRNLPVIVISGDEEEATKKRAREAGANDFITKTTDGTEILSRIDNLLRLVEARQQLEASRKAVEEDATHDPLTGILTLNYLLTEGEKRFSHARRRGEPLAVVSFRLDSYRAIADKVGASIADQLLARIAKSVNGALRAEDSIGRTGEATFAVVSAGVPAAGALAFARRLYGQLERAQVSYRGEPLKIRSSFGIAALDTDDAGSVRELMTIAQQRMLAAAERPGERVVGRDDIALVRPRTLPSDLERAVQVIESADAERLGDLAGEVLRRLMPFIRAACRRFGAPTVAERIEQTLTERVK